MPYAGQTIHNPLTREYITFNETAGESNGRYTRFTILQKAGGFTPVLHLHTAQDETFEILQGELTYILNNKKETAKKGDTILLPKGMAHTHYNAGKEDLLMIQTVSPSLDFDYALENLMGLSIEGKLPGGKPAFLQVMIWLRTFKSKTYLAKIPTGIQNGLAAILAPIGKLAGYKAIYKRFSGFDA